MAWLAIETRVVEKETKGWEGGRLEKHAIAAIRPLPGNKFKNTNPSVATQAKTKKKGRTQHGCYCFSFSFLW